MSSDWLKKEEEYRKLNADLVKRTQQLMEEVDQVMKIQDHMQNPPPPPPLPKDHTKSYLSGNCLRQKSAFDTNPRLSKFKNAAKHVINNLEDSENICLEDVPESVDQMGTKAMSRFFKAKLKKAQDDIAGLQQELKNKSEEVFKLQKENQKLLDEKDKWFQNYTATKCSTSKLENQVAALQSRVQAQDAEKISLKKEKEQLEKDLKSINVSNANTDLKLNRALEDAEKLRAALKQAKQDEKDLREAHRKETADLSNIIKKIEKHKSELISGFKKQMLLIDNLKRQKAHIEQYKLLENADNDFMKILDWKFDGI